ncbi:MAG: hypothetical protein HWN79_02800 [Candidatus Lokiarchaeota archaeon]|nr:hypothetical protein [Candidatus Lokiarchaeota archaeon]
MNSVSRGKYEILDLIFTFIISLCLVSTSIFLLPNLIGSLINIVVVIIFTVIVLNFWKSRNPFYIYLVRAFALNNIIVTFIAFLILSSTLIPIPAEYPGLISLLFPASIYLLISVKFSALSLLSKKGVGRLAYTGSIETAKHLLIRDNPEEGKKREELIASQKKKYNLNLIIALTIIFILYSFIAIFFGFY